MLPFGVTTPVIVPQRSEIRVGLMNYPVFGYPTPLLIANEFNSSFKSLGLSLYWMNEKSTAKPKEGTSTPRYDGKLFHEYMLSEELFVTYGLLTINEMLTVSTFSLYAGTAGDQTSGTLHSSTTSDWGRGGSSPRFPSKRPSKAVARYGSAE